MRAFGAEVELIDSPEGITPTLDPADAGARRGDRGRDRRVPDRPVQQPRHGRRLPGLGRGARSTSSTAASTRSPSTSAPPAASSGRHGRCATACRRSTGSRSSRPSRRSSRAAARAPTGSRAAASASCRRTLPDDIDEVIAVSTPTPSRWPAGRHARTGSGPARRPARTSPRRSPSRAGSGEGARVATIQVDSGLKYLVRRAVRLSAELGPLAWFAQRPRLAALIGASCIAFSGVFYLYAAVSPSTGTFYRASSGCRCSCSSRLGERRRYGPLPRERSGWRPSPASSSPAT